MDEDTVHATRSRNPLAMFALQPVGVSFDEQDEGEDIILLLRAHIVTLVPDLLEVVVLFVLPFVAVPIGSAIGFDLRATFSGGQIVLLLLSWYLFLFGFVFYKFIYWYFNVYLLTNERVVDFDFKGIVDQKTSYAYLRQVQDVSPSVVGFFGTFFHFGNVFIETAGEKPEFDFMSVARPDDVAREILEQRKQVEPKKETGGL
jgi:uncharacterized membrane protein YdbT with pleckstrin-like domain